MRKIRIGAPGFILAREMEQDFAGTVRRIAEIGFDGIEVTGFFGHSAEEFHEVFAQAGIEAFGCFALTNVMLKESLPESMNNWKDFYQAMEMPGQTPEENMEYLRGIGCGYIGLCMPMERPGEDILDAISRLSRLARAHGMKVQYHNHNWEYEDRIDGVSRMEELLGILPKEVLFEPDLGWMAIGGEDPFATLDKYKERIEIVHCKDYYRSGPDILDHTKPYAFRPTGYGVMDWARILSVCEEEIRPHWYVLDHDRAKDEASTYYELELSLDYMKKQISFL